MNYLIYIFVFLLGLIIGSFINCLIYRLHENKTLGGRSFCPHCKHQITWYDNIPVLSWLILRGKCRHCKKPISIQYPIVELTTGLLFVLSYELPYVAEAMQGMQVTSYEMNSVFLFRDLLIISVMIVIFIYDLKYYLILDRITLPAIILFTAINLYLGMNWQNLLISGIIGGSFFLIQFVVSKGKWIGGGDIRLGVLMGVILGWPMVILAIFLAYIIGSVISVGLVLSGKKKWGAKVPLGIFLTSATIITLFWGQALWDWYWNRLVFLI